MNKKNLQIVSFVLAIVPVITGLIGFMGINDPLYKDIAYSKNTMLDSNLRFFSGVWLGLGLALFSIVRTIDTETKIFRIVWLCIFIGGIGRLLSFFFVGLPPLPFVGFTLLEIVGAPIFIYWQKKVSIDNTR
jgi:hypothetical protein